MAIISLNVEPEVLAIRGNAHNQREELELDLKEALILNKLWSVHVLKFGFGMSAFWECGKEAFS